MTAPAGASTTTTETTTMHTRTSTFTSMRGLAGAALLGAALALPAARLAAQGAAPAGASERPAVITFEEALRIALRQNGAVRQAQNANDLDAATVRQQKLQLLPDLRLATSGAQSLGRNFNEAEGRIVDQTTQSLSAGLSSSVTLFDGLANVANLKGAQLAEEASTRDLTRTRQTVAFTVASNYLALVTQQEQLRVQEENMAAQVALEGQIQRFVDAGARPVSDLYQQQAAVAGARAAVVAARRALELAKVDVIQTLQLDPRGTYEFAPPTLADSADTGERYALDSLLTRAFADRVDLDAQASRVAAAEQGVRAATASRWPTVSLNAGYNSAFTSATDLAFVDQLDQRRGGSVGLSVSLPLFDRGSTAVAAQRARIEADNARLTLESRRQEVALQVRRAYLDHESAREQLAASEAQQRASDLAVRTTQERYRVGASTLVELTQARASQVEAASAVVSARYNLVFQRAVMTYYTGELDPARLALGD